MNWINRNGILVTLMLLMSLTVQAADIQVTSYGHFRQMVQQDKTAGVVELDTVIGANSYAVGALAQGQGEITIINGQVWLDYGRDGLGKAVKQIPAGEKAVLLATSKVDEWQAVTSNEALDQEALFDWILQQAEAHDLTTEAPFPFLLEGTFDTLQLHVINGRNPAFQGHGGQAKFYHQLSVTKTQQVAKVVGFYSATNQGKYTHPGESWHLHAVLESDDMGAHIDGIVSGHPVVLKLPKGSNW